jgi:hypothetical protein
MTRCPVEGCSLPVGFGSKGLARDAAALEAFFPVFDRAKQLWPDKFPREFFAFVDMGRGLFRMVHERAHGIGPVVLPVQQIKEWRKAAASSCEGIAIVDPEWFREYWTEVEARGLKLPFAIYQTVRAIEADGHPALPDDVNGGSEAKGLAHPTGVGWVEPVTLDVHEGEFVMVPPGVAFIPRIGDSDYGCRSQFPWSSILGARAVSVGPDYPPLKAHSAVLDLAGISCPDQMVVAFVQAHVPNDRLLGIIPVNSCTVDDWLEGFRDAGIEVEGATS